MKVWETLNVIGTIAFALSGVNVALEERYDLMGVYILGFITAFGGGAVRNLLIGVPVSELWEQGALFTVAFLVMTFAFVFPRMVRWTLLRRGIFFDSIGLGAFSVQGALYAQSMGLPLSAAIAAAALTGTGGGMIRDVLAGRKPLFLQKEIYIAWTVIPGVVVGLGWLTSPLELLLVVAAVVTLRLCSVYYGWSLPSRLPERSI
ncbi:trimeric intracellular cation channel family protein [Alkalicoccus halolimnae]|uniref:Trimeric intracellular cation channel family protein n=1 Tax=Alkalicoccus halolimnae TaxID=1667239 RepID=A0A5C7FCW1_9BACI|nr:trimeric intracellular cation channel family protein [Alkalicoccus halolimnae]TXF82334.1 trimeric intracellular cation channel family protein [Alkalicoccus halolimnae]